MNLYLLSQKDNVGYDTYDACIVVAQTPGEAQLLHPGGDVWHTTKKKWVDKDPKYQDWDFRNTWTSHPKKVKVTYIGIADSSLEANNNVVLASFNAG